MNALENDKYMDKHDKAQQKILEADERKQDIHHFNVTDESGFDNYIVAYVLKAEYPNGSQYAIGVYSKGDYKDMNAHAKRHTERTGHRCWDMECTIQIN